MSSKKNKLLESAQKNIQKGQYGRAIKEYEEIISLDSGDVRHRQKLAELLTKANRTDDAIKEYTALAKHYVDAVYYLKAIAVYKQIQKLDPANPDISLTLASLNEKQGLIGNAIAEYNSALQLYEANNENKNSLKVLESLLALDQRNSAIRLRIAEKCFTIGEEQKALECFTSLAHDLRSNGDENGFNRVATRLTALFPDQSQAIITPPEPAPDANGSAGAASVDKQPPAVPVPAPPTPAMAETEAALPEKQISPTFAEPLETEEPIETIDELTEFVDEQPDIDHGWEEDVDLGSMDDQSASGLPVESGTLQIDELEEIGDQLSGEADLDLEIETELEFEIEEDLDLESELEPLSESRPEIASDLELESYAELELEASVEHDLAVEPQLEPETELTPYFGLETEDEPVTAFNLEIESELELESDPDTEKEAASLFGAELDLEEEADSGFEPEGAPTPGSELRYEPDTGSDPVLDLEIQEEFAPGLDLEIESELELGSDPEPESETALESGAELDLDNGSEPEFDSEIKPDGAPELAAEPQFEQETVLTPDFGLETEVKVTPELDLEMESKLEIESDLEWGNEAEQNFEPETEPELQLGNKQEFKQDTGLGPGIELETELQSGPDLEAGFITTPVADTVCAAAVTEVPLDDAGQPADTFDLAGEISQFVDELDFMLPRRENGAAPFAFDSAEMVMTSDIDQEDAESHYNLGLAYKEMGLYDEAISEFIVAAHAPAREIDCLLLQSQCHRDKGDPSRAEAILTFLMEQTPVNEDELLSIKYELALCNELSGKTESARRLFTEIIALCPGFSDAASRLKTL